MFEDLFSTTTTKPVRPQVKTIQPTTNSGGMFSDIFSQPKKTITPTAPVENKPILKTVEDYASSLLTPVFKKVADTFTPNPPETFGQGSLLKKATDFVSLLPSSLNTVRNALATAYQETPLFSIPVAAAPTSEQNAQEIKNSPLNKFNEKVSAMTPGMATELTFGFIPDKARQQAKDIATQTTTLDTQKTELDNLNKTLTDLQTTNPAQFNKLLPNYNQKIKEYNDNLAQIKDKTAAYLSLPEIQHPNYAAAGSAIGMLTAYSELGKVFAPIVPKISALFPETFKATKTGALITRAVSQGLGYTVPLFATGETLQEGMKQLSDNQFDPKLLLKSAERGATFGATTGVASSFATTPIRMVAQAFNFGGWNAMDKLVANGKLTKTDIPGIIISAGQGLLFANQLMFYLNCPVLFFEYQDPNNDNYE